MNKNGISEHQCPTGHTGPIGYTGKACTDTIKHRTHNRMIDMSPYQPYTKTQIVKTKDGFAVYLDIQDITCICEPVNNKTMKYKLIKNYPGAPQVGMEVRYCPECCRDATSAYRATNGDFYEEDLGKIECYPEFWQEIKEPKKEFTIEDMHKAYVSFCADGERLSFNHWIQNRYPEQCRNSAIK